ncbi:MAG: alpha/beta fold hydrolase [Deltaproteobacteria bacterium]|nr:alpha/beta fold hydrolase [Deltaproteobacteria bacterium]
MEWNLIRIWFEKLLDALRMERTVGSTAIDPPEQRAVRPFEITVDHIPIRGSAHFPVAHPARLYPTLIICHGIPGSGAARPVNDPGYEGLATEFTSLGMAAIIFNFRGCGDSGGNFDMMGWTRDLDAVVRHTLDMPHVDPSRLIVIGFSGGGAAAINVAADTSRIYGLAVVGTPATFDIFEKEPVEIIEDFQERGIIRDPGFPADIGKWMDGFAQIEPRRWIAQFQGQYALIVHGDADDLVPVDHAPELKEHAPAGVAELRIVPHGEHRLRLDERCVKILKDWTLKILGLHGSW